MNNKLYIFDLDGTLIDSQPDVYNGLISTLGHFQLSVSKERLYEASTMGVLSLFKELETDSHSSKRINEYFQDYFLKHITDTTKIHEGMVKTLTTLQENHELVILTNKIKIYTDKTLENLDLRRFFTQVYYGDSFEEYKPSPLPIEKILEKHPYKKSNVIIIGDSKSDILAGQGAGIKTCLVKYGYGDLDFAISLNPDFIVEKAPDILNIQF